MNKGFVIMAQNTTEVKYSECAEVLRDSILRCMPNSNVTIITEGEPGFSTDYEVYNKSPYEYTIKLEADMFIPKSIEHWWDILKYRDIVVSSTIRNYKGEISNVRAYRKFIDDNNLPDVYNAITYFKKSDKAEQFFNTVNNIFQHWEEYKKILKCNVDEEASTDWVYAIACHIMGTENTTMDFPGMSMVHMKQYVNDLVTEDWTKELLTEYTNPIKIATFPQEYPLHYYVKDFRKQLKDHYVSSIL